MISPRKFFIWCSIYVLCSSSGLCAFKDGSPGFLLTGPKHATWGTEEKYCLYMQGIQGATAASLELFCEKCEPSQIICSAHEQLTAESSNGSCILLTLNIPFKYNYKPHQLRLKVYREDPEGLEKPEVIVEFLKSINLLNLKRLELLETDKPSYKPGQPLRLQTLSLDHRLRPVPSVKKHITHDLPRRVEDRRFTKNIVSSDLGLSDHEFDKIQSLKLEGLHKIVVRHNVGASLHTFDVSHNVSDLRFLLIAPEQVLRNSSFNVTICANQKDIVIKGKSWAFDASVQVLNHPDLTNKYGYRKLEWDRETHCTKPLEVDLPSWLPEFVQSDQDLDLKVSAGVHNWRSSYPDPIYDDTIIVRVVSDERKPQPVHLSLETPPNFKLGLPFIGKVLAREKPNGKFISGENVTVCITEGYANPNLTSPEWIIYPEEEKCQTLVTEDNGDARFFIVPKDDNAVLLKTEVYDHENNGNRSLRIRALAKPSYSPSFTFAAIAPFSQQVLACNSALKVKIYLTNVENDEMLRLSYLVTGRGDLLTQGMVEDYVRATEFDVPGALDESTLPFNVSTFEFELHVAPDFYPNATLTVFFTQASELVTAQAKLRIAPCYPNPVSFQWNTNTAVAGGKAGFTVNAAPGSVCRVAVVDETVALYKSPWRYGQEPALEQLAQFAIDPRAEPLQKTPDRLYCTPKTPQEGRQSELENEAKFVQRSFYEDVIQSFDMAGLLVMSNWTLESRPCHSAFISSEELVRSYTFLSDDGFVGGQEEYIKDVLWTEERDRSMEKLNYIPETSMWELHEIDSTGVAHLESTLASRGGPWVGRALCVSNTSGFGMSPEVKISVPELFSFDFELSDNLATKGEPFHVNLTVKNLLNSTLPVEIRIERSQEFELVSGVVYRDLCISAKGSAVVQYPIRPIVLRPFTVRAKAEVVQYCNVENLPSFNVRAQAVFNVIQKIQDNVLAISQP